MNPDPPVTIKKHPEGNFEEISMDLFTVDGRDYLATVCNRSDWVEIDPMGNAPTSAKVIAALRQHFARFRSPMTLWSANGPQFASKEFQEFLSDWRVVHRTSVPPPPEVEREGGVRCQNREEAGRGGLHRKVDTKPGHAVQGSPVAPQYAEQA